MDQQAASRANIKIAPTDLDTLRRLISHDNKFMHALMNSICNDNECVFQDNDRDRINHIYESVKLIRNEALQSFIQAYQLIKTNNQMSTIDLNWLIEFLRLMANKSQVDLSMTSSSDENNNEEDNNDNEILTKICQISHDIYVDVSDANESQLTLDKLDLIVNLIKDIFFKYKTSSVELCIRLGRIITLLAIRLRDKTDLNETAALLQVSEKKVLQQIKIFEKNNSRLSFYSI